MKHSQLEMFGQASADASYPRRAEEAKPDLKLLGDPNGCTTCGPGVLPEWAEKVLRPQTHRICGIAS